MRHSSVFSRTKTYLTGMSLTGIIFLSACSTMEFKSPSSDNLIVLSSAQEQAKCETLKTQGQWSLLFGMFPINRIKLEDLFSSGKSGESKKGSYHIVERVGVLDATVTLLGGWLLTLTRKTVEVKICQEDLMVTTRSDFNKRVAALEKSYHDKKRKEIADALAKYSVGRGRGAKDPGTQPIVITKNGQSYQGEIVEFSSTRLVLLIREEIALQEDPNASAKKEGDTGAPDESPKTKKVDQIILKSGKTIEGRILTQNSVSVTIRLEKTGNSESVSKDTIRRIKYSVTVNIEPEKVEPKYTVTRKVIARSNISRIILRK